MRRVRRLVRSAWAKAPPGVKRMYARLPSRLTASVRAKLWSTSDTAELTRAYIERHGLEVRRGPLKGLSYPPDLVGKVDALVPKLIGSYEAELHEPLERLLSPSVVNIGSADGYYAVGLARLGLRVRAFDPDRTGQETTLRLAEHNGVTVTVSGAFKPETLRDLDDGTALIICDCEGCEANVLQPDVLRDCNLIVELHDFVKPGLGDQVVKRFSSTHDIEVIPQRPRDTSTFSEVEGLPHPELAVAEGRPEQMRWAVMTPRR
jgi:hypothetical protein